MEEEAEREGEMNAGRKGDMKVEGRERERERKKERERGGRVGRASARSRSGDGNIKHSELFRSSGNELGGYEPRRELGEVTKQSIGSILAHAVVQQKRIQKENVACCSISQASFFVTMIVAQRTSCDGY